ncbi:MAG: DUF4465 domain-containing protein [Planctomycetia bacterium]|nr:DUF4465 domain-containing protein [Planctomycetia bacterium]
MNRRCPALFLACVVGLCLSASGLRASVVDFEDLTVPAAGYYDGDPGTLTPGQSVSVPWTSESVAFSNTYGIDGDYGFPYWYGFAYSDLPTVMSGTAKGDFADQYLSLPGGGFSSSTYAIAYADGATVTLPAVATVSGFQIANTAYTGLTLLNGDSYGFAAPLSAGGWFATIATGKLGTATTGSATYYLADLRTGSSPGVLTTWAWFDLTPLGAVDRIEFTFEGSDTSPPFGLNTPAYFAMDAVTFTAVPEPATAVAFGLAAVAAVASHVRRVRSRRRDA